ncbi:MULTISPECIES: hypothetical protein [Moorena]|uniref:hypothetical protein n=1 Tax=Moorena TaxID=1155738 RepID=UPI000309E44F|nr:MULTISPECIES: hypothetical protein [Moorena]NEP32637.1 hypothetical protein [Moorena sp. SIO3B2]NEP68301.1 hypothetical protein [Moorena sp. SIO3A5]NES39926.1 hypothetical protein [Moorena sp. SIO2C4]
MANLIRLRKTHHYGLGEAARSWGFPPLAIAVVSPTRYCIKTTGKHSFNLCYGKLTADR